jgi:hypothetical protein
VANEPASDAKPPTTARRVTAPLRFKEASEVCDVIAATR